MYQNSLYSLFKWFPWYYSHFSKNCHSVFMNQKKIVAQNAHYDLDWKKDQLRSWIEEEIGPHVQYWHSLMNTSIFNDTFLNCCRYFREWNMWKTSIIPPNTYIWWSRFGTGCMAMAWTYGQRSNWLSRMQYGTDWCRMGCHCRSLLLIVSAMSRRYHCKNSV